MMDVVPRYLSCTPTLLSKCRERLICSIHKALTQPRAHTTTSKGVLCLQEGRAAIPSLSKAPWFPISMLFACCGQMSPGVSCGSKMWVKVRAGLTKGFAGIYQGQAIKRYRYLNSCLKILG